MASNGMVTLEATIDAGPPTVSSASFPRGNTDLPFTLKAGSTGKAAPRQTGSMVIELASAGAYQTLDGVGTGKTVTKANLVFIQTNVPMLVRLTFKDPAGGADILSILPIDGPLLLEPDVSGYCKLIEVKGAGTVNWYASGAE